MQLQVLAAYAFGVGSYLLADWWVLLLIKNIDFFFLFYTKLSTMHKTLLVVKAVPINLMEYLTTFLKPCRVHEKLDKSWVLELDTRTQ